LKNIKYRKINILTYKRTHIGDPDKFGRFGIEDCMGQIRKFSFDAVIGIGGKSAEPRSFGIDGKINWVGIFPKKSKTIIRNSRAPIIEFEHFILLENNGPSFESHAPRLAERMYGGRRFLFKAYSEQEKIEAISILEWALKEITSQVPINQIASRKSFVRFKCKVENPKKQCRRLRQCRSPKQPIIRAKICR
jgi:hypothetical protein